ncbi:MAG: alpha-(1-_3)-arabinofuranosyltransferase family protein, partial [Solirubrobacteraceae bacterium]
MRPDTMPAFRSPPLRAGLSSRPGLLPPALGLLALVLAFVQRPGLTFTDTRIDLTVNPALFLSRVTQVFSGTADLGHVQSGQYVGYLFPMGPWYDLMHLLGIPTWVGQRLWLAALLFAAAYGVVRLLDVLLGSERGPAHALAAVLYAVNPLVVVYISRASGTLLALAVLPWVMLAVVGGVWEPRSWQWPVLIGLIAALSGGGINAAQVAWIALAPVALLIWEATVGRAGRGAAFQFGLRATVCAFAGAAWWLIPAILQGSYGADFLRFTELPQTIWATTSASESLRLLGYWPMYLGTGYGA